jgi:hypothetical protein
VVRASGRKIGSASPEGMQVLADEKQCELLEFSFSAFGTFTDMV